MDKNILYIVSIIILIFIIFKYYKMEIFSSSSDCKSKNAICFMTRDLDVRLLNFAELCSEYNDTYIIVDNNEKIIQDSSSNVRIVQIDNSECGNNNYIKSTWRFNLYVTAWDKAFYYFCENNNYDNVWFIEDDVFISKPYVLNELDNKYGDSDILIRYITHVTNPKSKDGAWNNIVGDLNKFPDMSSIYWSWVCAMRCSKKLLNIIKEFKNKNNQLYFHELLIPSLVKNNNLSYKCIDELKNIIYRYEYNDENIISNPTYLFHPMKDYDKNEKLRLMINDF